MTVGCGDDGDYPLDGESCDNLCGGPACNYRCDDDILYHCGSDNELSFVEDCGEQGLACVFVENPDQPGDGDKLCQ
jgi:hypothetical protein